MKEFEWDCGDWGSIQKYLEGRGTDNRNKMEPQDDKIMQKKDSCCE